MSAKSRGPHGAICRSLEREILALAIFSEEEDSKIYRGFAEGLREQYPASAKVFDEMADEEVRHRTMLFDLYRSKFGDFLPLIRRQDVKGFIKRKPLWLTRPLGLDEVRKYAETMELEWARFYHKAAQSARDFSIPGAAGQACGCGRRHESLASKLSGETILTKAARAREDETSRRLFVLRYVQPGLAGLMDGSVSTLAPLFAAAFATHNPWQTFLVGIAASVGAGISMAFAEALSDDGSLTGRGAPVLRGVVCGAMTTAGGLAIRCPISSPIFSSRPSSPYAWLRRSSHHLVYPPSIHGYAIPRSRVSSRGRGVLVFVAGIAIGSS